MARVFYPGQDPETDPTLKRELRLDQLEAIYRLEREVTTGSCAALVGAGMGSGKTVVSVEVMLHTAPKRVLIVGVKDAYGQWRDAVRDQQTGADPTPLLRIDGTAPGRANLARLVAGEDAWFYIGLEMLRAQDWVKVSETIIYPDELVAMFGGPKYVEQTTIQQVHTYKQMKELDLLISDESHRHSQQQTGGIKTVREIPTKAKIALSGTFYGNKFENAWTTATWLWGKKTIGTKGAFERDYCVKEPVLTKPDPKTGRQRQVVKNGYALTKITGERIPGEFVETLPCYVYIATPIGPPPDPEIVEIDLSAEQDRQYREMEKQALTWIKDIDGNRAPLVADLPLTQRLRLRTAALGGMTLVPGADENDPDSITFEPGTPSSTLNAAYHVLHRPSWEGKKALILTHSKQFAIEAARRIGQKYTVALKAGGVRDWDEAKRRFMLPVSETDSIQYLVAVISAVGTATDGLQANCAKVLWLSEDDNNTNNIQGSNRVWRDGVNLEEYEAVKIVARGTIAEGVLKKNDQHRVGVLDSISGQN